MCQVLTNNMRYLHRSNRAFEQALINKNHKTVFTFSAIFERLFGQLIFDAFQSFFLP
jgi:hypothetical protein